MNLKDCITQQFDISEWDFTTLSSTPQETLEELGLFSLIFPNSNLEDQVFELLEDSSSTKELLTEYQAWATYFEDSIPKNKEALLAFSNKKNLAQRLYCAEKLQLPKDYNLSKESMSVFNTSLREIFRNTLVQNGHPQLRAFYFADLLHFYLQQCWSQPRVTLKYDFSISRLMQVIDMLADQQKAKNIIEVYALLYALHEAQDILIELQEVKIDDGKRHQAQVKIVGTKLKEGLKSLFSQREIFHLMQEKFPAYDFLIKEKPSLQKSLAGRFARRGRK